jgi:hypothetical protein
MLYHRRLAAGVIITAIAIAAAACGSSATQAPTSAPTPAPTATPAPATPAPVETSAAASAAPGESGAVPSLDIGSFLGHADPALEAKLPSTFNGVTLSKSSSKGTGAATGGATNPFAGFLGAFGASTSTAFAFDTTGSSQVVFFAIQLTGTDAKTALGTILPAIQASQTGFKVSTANIGGKDVTVMVGPSGATYLYPSGDVLYIVGGVDDTTGPAALQALP